MIMKPKAKKFSFAKLFVFGLIMLVLQIATFAGDLPASLEDLKEADKLEIAEAPYSDYAQLYSYDAYDNPFSTTMSYHESMLLGLICIAAVIAANFRAKTVSRTIARGCWAFAVMNFIMHLAFGLIDSLTWYTPYSLMDCSPFTFGILTTIVGAVLGVVAFFADPVIDMIDKKVEAKRWANYEAERKAAREEELASEARKAASVTE